MSSQANTYLTYARECVRLAEEASSLETRDKLLTLARDWMNSATVEEETTDPQLVAVREAASLRALERLRITPITQD
jgi:hypothetical protein